MEQTRQEKVARLIQKELGDIFLQYARKQQGVLISVTHVNVTSDLSIARVYISLFPQDKSQNLFDMLQANIKTVRFELGQRLRHQLRIIPELTLYLDDSLDYSEHIDNLLKQ